MPLLTAQDTLRACRQALTEDSQIEANQRIRKILSEQYGVAEVLLLTLDFSTFMAPINYPAGSAFHLSENSSPEEEIAIRILLQIVLQRSYNILTEEDLVEVETTQKISLEQDRTRRIEAKLSNAHRSLLAILAEECDDIEIFYRLNEQLNQLSQGVNEDMISDLTQKILPDLLRRYSTFPAIYRNLNDLQEALIRVYNINREHSVVMSRAPYTADLLEKQREAALSLKKMFCRIPALLRVCDYLWDNIETSNRFDEQSNFLYALSQDETVNPEIVYDTRVERPYQGVVNVANLTKLYDARFNPRIIELIASRNLKGFRAIRGDGNCYYRAAIIGLLEQLIFCSRDERQARFTYLLGQFQKLIDDSILRAENIPAVRLVIDILKEAAEGRSLLTIQELEQFLFEHDVTLVTAMRSAMTNSLLTDLSVTYNDLTLEAAVMSGGYQSVEQYVDILMKMGECAEGPAVHACLLNTFLGANLYSCLLQRDSCTINSNPTNLPNVGSYPPIDIHLLFKPGHYDLLETTAVYDAIRAAESQHASNSRSPRAPVFDHSLPRPKGVQSQGLPPASGLLSAPIFPEPIHHERNVDDIFSSGDSLPLPLSSFRSRPREEDVPPSTMDDVLPPNKPMASSGTQQPRSNPRDTDRKPNYMFIFSVFSSPKVSRIAAALLLLSALALIGAVSFGAIPVMSGVILGVACSITSLGMFVQSRSHLVNNEGQEVRPRV